MPSRKRPVLDGTMLRQRLAALRRRMRMVAAVRGVGWLATVVLAAAAVAGLIDWQWRLPELIRAVVLVGTLSGAIYVFYRYLFRPLSARGDDLSLALRIEEEYPSLNDSLASTVQFLDRGMSGPASSAALEREAVKRALARAENCDFRKVVNTRGLKAAGVSGGLFAALAVALVLLSPALAKTALLRLANPFGGHDWPKKTFREIEEPRSRIGRNEAFEVRGLVRGVVPPQAVISFRFEGFPNLEHHCDIQLDEAGVGHLLAHPDPALVQHNFRFQVRANDAVSREYRVEVLSPPSLVALDGNPSPQVQLFYPAYTQLPSPEQLSPGTGNIDAVAGTRVLLRARADRPLRRAWIEYLPEQPVMVLGSYFAPLGGTDAVSAVALSAGAGAWSESMPAMLESDQRTFTIDFNPTVNGNYALHFEDEIGLSDQRLFELRLHPDPAPTVRLERPTAARDILSVLPTAELDLEVLADDPQFGLRSVFLEYRTERNESPRRLSLYDPAAGPAPLLSPWTGSALLAAPPMPLRPKQLIFRQKLPLSSLYRGDGGKLREGDVVLLRACADDFDDVSVRKEPGRSHEVEIRIVGRNAFDLVLNQEQAAIQQQLLRLREKQRDALRKVTEAENRLKKGDKLTPEDQEKLLQAEQLQQQIRERVGTEKDGLRGDLKRIRDALRQNGLQKTAPAERMNDVAREINRLADNELQQIEPRLTNARQLAELLEEKTRAERKASLDAQAKDIEREAKNTEKESEKAQKQAEQTEKKAEQSDNAAEKARQRQEAERMRRRAAQLRQKAGELQRQAERQRQDAEQAPDPNKPRQALAEAKKGQEEVEKTLSDLLNRRLEAWTSSHEIKGEAKRLLEEQKQLQAETEKMMAPEKGLVAKSPEELNKRQKAELDDLKEAQRKLEERTRQLLDKMDRVAKERENKDPETANELREAREEAQKDELTEQMKAAREQIEKNQLSQAAKTQKENVERLKKLVKNLEDKREAELDRLVKKLKQKEKELDDLISEQEQLQKKIQEAGRIGDKAQREEELTRLARKQEQLQKKAKEMVEQLTRMRAARAGQALGEAGGQMEEAGKQLSGGRQGDDEQEETLARLNEARRELKRARQEAEEELTREQIDRLADLIKRLKERQEALNQEATRIQDTVRQKAAWSRGLRISLQAGSRAQKGLGEEVEETATKRLTAAPVFARMMRRAGEAMSEAGKRMEAVVKKSSPPAELPDVELTRAQERALRRLTQVVDALKDAAGQMDQARGGDGQEGGGEQGGGQGGAPGDSIPTNAQLKLLRDLQKDVNQRTEAFKKQHLDLKKLGENDKAELQSIRNDQRDVAELIDEMTRPADEPERGEGEKK